MIGAVAFGLGTFVLMFSIMWIGMSGLWLSLAVASFLGLLIGFYYHKSESDV